MKRMLTLLILAIFLIPRAYAQDPIISNNVVVLQNTTAAQCPASYRGTGQPTNVSADTAFGPASGTTGAMIQSCTGCTFDSRAKTCTCRVCYGYFN